MLTKHNWTPYRHIPTNRMSNPHPRVEKIISLAAFSLLFCCLPGCHMALLHVAWMAPEKRYSYFNASSSAGALALALEDVIDMEILPGYEFK